MEFEKNSEHREEENSPKTETELQMEIFVAKPRSVRTVVTPSRYTSLWPRGQSSPKRKAVSARRLNFDL